MTRISQTLLLLASMFCFVVAGYTIWSQLGLAIAGLCGLSLYSLSRQGLL